MIRTVGELRRALEEFPDYRGLGVEIIVGGDIRTDTVWLEQLRQDDVADVVLVPAASSYDVAEHIDNGLAAYAAIEEATYHRAHSDPPADDVEEVGFLRYTRDDTVPGGFVLDHVAAWRVTVYDGAGPKLPPDIVADRHDMQ